MRIFAIASNFGLLLLLATLIFISGGVPAEAREIAITTLILTAAGANLFVLLCNKVGKNVPRGLIALYFQRKRLEEQLKINQLSSKAEGKASK